MAKIIKNAEFSEQLLFNELSQLIERSKKFVATQANSTLTLLFWNIGKRINETILQNKRADYGKQIVVTLARQLSWSHFLALIPLKTKEAKLFYAEEVLMKNLGVKVVKAKGNHLYKVF